MHEFASEGFRQLFELGEDSVRCHCGKPRHFVPQIVLFGERSKKISQSARAGRRSQVVAAQDMHISGRQPDKNIERFVLFYFIFFSSSFLFLGALIWGSPWQPEFCDWAFNLPRAGEEIRAKWKLIPAATDILVTHGPPRGGVGGICRDGFDAGCEVLTERIKEVKPLVHICGHIHECYGVFALGDTLVINASSVNLSYRPTNPPIVFDIVKL